MASKRFILLAILFVGVCRSCRSEDLELDKCYHRVLGVKPSITKTRDIKRAYREKAKHVHPDKNKSSSAIEKFHLLNEALGFMLVPDNRMRLRDYLKKEENKKKCGWRFDRPILGSAVDWSWWLLEASGRTVKDAAVMISDAAGNVYAEYEQTKRLQTKVTNLVYLDDSGSMSHGYFTSWLDVAHPLYQKMSPSFQGTPTRMVLFGSSKRILVEESEKMIETQDVLHQWEGLSGGTYMWHMIQEEVRTNFKPSASHRLRVFVITDGEDNWSPREYRGVKGMNPMMSTLKKAGYDIEFHIVVLGETALDASYKDLAQATGGNFLFVEWSKRNSPNTNKEIESFVQQIADYASKEDPEETEQMRVKKREEYEREVEAGTATKFEWYEQLPGHANA